MSQFKLINMTFTHESNIEQEERLTLKDYDIHTWYLNKKIEEQNIPLEKQLELYKYENLHRAWILQGNYVKSNINRINNWYKWITRDKSVSGKRAILLDLI